MRYFTSNPLERLMMQAPPPRQEQRAKPAPPKDHPCHGCKRCGESCVLPSTGVWKSYRPFRTVPDPGSNINRTNKRPRFNLRALVIQKNEVLSNLG